MLRPRSYASAEAVSTAPEPAMRRRRNSPAGRSSFAATAPLAGAAAIEYEALDLYAYHLERVTKTFNTMISAENADLLARLLSDEERA